MASTDKSRSTSSERLTPENALLMLVDHQTGLMLGVHTIAPIELRNNVIALAKLAKIYGLPVILTTSASNGPNGPIMGELNDLFPDTDIIDRTLINAWDDERIVNVVRKTGRKKIIMAGITTDVCLAFPATSATAAGYDVYAVLDASGTWNELVEHGAIVRMAQAGVITTNWVAVAAELQRDWKYKTAPDVAKLFGEYLGPYGYMINTFEAKSKAGHKRILTP